MKQALAIALLFLAGACGGISEERQKTLPVSVRGWILDVETPGAGTGDFKTVETEAARRIALFQQTSVWIENMAFVSGGVAETGAFLLLDVPPGNVTISFNAPGAENAQLVLQNIPPGADVIIPGLVLKQGGSTLSEPDKVIVRIAGTGNETKRSGATATIAGRPIPIVEVPLNSMQDRREYPDPAGGQTSVTVLK